MKVTRKTRENLAARRWARDLSVSHGGFVEPEELGRLGSVRHERTTDPKCDRCGTRLLSREARAGRCEPCSKPSGRPA